MCPLEAKIVAEYKKNMKVPNLSIPIAIARPRATYAQARPLGARMRTLALIDKQIFYNAFALYFLFV